jgi:hypothetical protein
VAEHQRELVTVPVVAVIAERYEDGATAETVAWVGG